MIMIIVFIIIVIVILGVIAGGESFGDTLRKGCGCVVTIIVIGLIIFLIFFADKM